MKYYVIWADKTGKMLWAKAFHDKTEADEFAGEKHLKTNVPCIVVSSESPIDVNIYYAG